MNVAEYLKQVKIDADRPILFLDIDQVLNNTFIHEQMHHRWTRLNRDGAYAPS